jgi:hypothetical protein
MNQDPVSGTALNSPPPNPKMFDYKKTVIERSFRGEKQHKFRNLQSHHPETQPRKNLPIG